MNWWQALLTSILLTPVLIYISIKVHEPGRRIEDYEKQIEKEERDEWSI